MYMYNLCPCGLAWLNLQSHVHIYLTVALKAIRTCTCTCTCVLNDTIYFKRQCSPSLSLFLSLSLPLSPSLSLFLSLSLSGRWQSVRMSSQSLLRRSHPVPPLPLASPPQSPMQTHSQPHPPAPPPSSGGQSARNAKSVLGQWAGLTRRERMGGVTVWGREGRRKRMSQEMNWNSTMLTQNYQVHSTYNVQCMCTVYTCCGACFVMLANLQR